MQDYLEFLFNAVRGADKILILTHNNPDPDAIASALALQHLLHQKLEIKSDIVYQGIISRAENRALLSYLGYPLKLLDATAAEEKSTVALVDTQPGAGNNALPSQADVAIVIDHHPLQENTMAAKFADVRLAVGSTSTILTEYLQQAQVKLTPQVATALFYGIKTDTMGLSRGVSRADVEAYSYLQPYINTNALIEIEQAQVPISYFKIINSTLKSARLYRNIVTAYIGRMDYPDMAAEMADLLLRLEGSQWVICLGIYNDKMMLSVRTRHPHGGAGQLARAMIANQGTAGGHGVMAGGQAPLTDQNVNQLAAKFIQRGLRHLKIEPGLKGIPLV